MWLSNEPALFGSGLVFYLHQIASRNPVAKISGRSPVIISTFACLYAIHCCIHLVHFCGYHMLNIWSCIIIII